MVGGLDCSHEIVKSELATDLMKGGGVELGFGSTGGSGNYFQRFGLSEFSLELRFFS